MAAPELVQCNACGGVYQPLQRDGTRYFHACPDQKVIGIVAAPTKDDPDATKQVFAPIANRRDENIVVDDKGKASAKTETVGATPVTDPATIAAFTGAK